MPAVIDIFDGFMSLVASDPADGGLGIQPMLGFPELGRPEIQYPAVAMVFSRMGYQRSGQIQRLGKSTPEHYQCGATLFCVDLDEYRLLGLIDKLIGLMQVGGMRVGVDNTPIKIAYGPVERVNMTGDVGEQSYVVSITVNFRWNGG